MAQLCCVLAARLARGTPLTDRLFDWQGDIAPRGDSVPLRLCGALHALHLQGDPALAAVYPPHIATDDALWLAVSQVLAGNADFIDTFIHSPPQTNEVRRAAALIAAGHVIVSHFPNSMRVSELGASAGLNLDWNRFALDINGARLGQSNATVTLPPDWTGATPPIMTPKEATTARR
jgi:hypothetical protein